MAALFALFGMFAIYRLQTEGNKKHDLISSIKLRVSQWSFHVPKGITTWTDSEFVRELKLAVKKMEENQKLRQEADLTRKITILKADIENISNVEHLIIRIKSRLGLPIRLVFYTFILSIIALPFAELFSNLFFGLLFMFFIIVLTLKAALEIINFIFYVFAV